jgi:hypothetical protein
VPALPRVKDVVDVVLYLSPETPEVPLVPEVPATISLVKAKTPVAEGNVYTFVPSVRVLPKVATPDTLAVPVTSRL